MSLAASQWLVAMQSIGVIAANVFISNENNYKASNMGASVLLLTTRSIKKFYMNFYTKINTYFLPYNMNTSKLDISNFHVYIAFSYLSIIYY